MLKKRIDEIKERFSFNNKELSHLLDIKMNELLNCNTEKTIISKLIKIFNITEEDITKEKTPLPTLIITKPLNMNKYKNKLNAYNEVIKSHYTPNWKIFVLTKTKVKQKFTIGSFFKKEKLEKFTQEFTPSFIAINNNTKLLINFKENNLIITELKISDENVFILNNTKYKKANEIKI